MRQLATVVAITLAVSALAQHQAAAQRAPTLVPQLAHRGILYAVSVSADGRTALTVGNGVKLWDLLSSSLLRTLSDDEMYAGGITGDARFAAALGFGSILVWDVESGVLSRRISLPSSAAVPAGLALSRRGSLAAAVMDDSSTGVFDIATGAQLYALRTAKASRVLTFSPDDQRLAVGSEDGLVHIHDLSSRRVVASFRTAGRGAGSLAFSASGAQLAVVADGTVVVWNLNTRERSFETSVPSAHAAAFARAGAALMVATADGHGGALLELDLQTGDELARQAYPYGISSLAVLPDDQRAVVVGWLDPVRIYERGVPLEKQTLMNGAAGRGSGPVAFAADGSLLYHQADAQLRALDLTTLRPVRKPPARSNVRAISPSGKLVTAAPFGEPSSEYFEIFDAGGERLIRHSGRLNTAKWSPDERFVLAGMPDKTVLLNIAERRAQWSVPTPPVVSVDVAPDGKRGLVSLLRRGGLQLLLLDLANGRVLREFRAGGERGGPALFGAGGKLAIGASKDLHGSPAAASVWSWEVDSGRLVGSLSGHRGVSALALSPRGDRLAVADHALRIHVWDLASSTLVRQLDGHLDIIDAMAFSPDDALLASVDRAALKLWPMNGGPGVSVLESGEEWVAYSDDGTFDASLEGSALVAAVVGRNAHRIDQLAVQNNRPDVLLGRLGLGAPELLAHFRARHATRLRRVQKQNQSAGLSAAPSVQVASVRVDGRVADVTIALDAGASGLAAYQIYMNGVPLFRAPGKQSSGRHQQIHERVALLAGRNRLEVGATSVDGVESLRPYRTLHAGEPEQLQGNLYYLGFGVSRYRNASYDLRFAHKDARDLAAALALLEGHGFEHVFTRTYTDAEVTVDNIRKARPFLAQAHPMDTVILFVAGHGLRSSDAAADYYFGTHELDLRDMERTSARFELLEDLLQGIAARSKLMLVDTCVSGDQEANLEAQAFSGDAPGAPRALRTRDIVLAQGGTRMARPFLAERDRLIYGDLLGQTGAFVIASSTGDEFSYEKAELQNGVFTEQLLRGLAGEADADRDDHLSIEELHTYLTESVAARTDELQHPTLLRNNRDARLALRVATGAASVADRSEPASSTPDGAQQLATVRRTGACACDMVGSRELGSAWRHSFFGCFVLALLGWRRAARRAARSL